jgi:negative regulator of sigma-B (phosphoserine phosphatase)
VRDGVVEVGVATLPLEGQQESGDLHLVKPFEGGVLVAAVDGLGHGGDAASAARLACSTLEDDPAAALPELFERCHRRLARTRGVVMSLASFTERDGGMTWLGVGNVEGVLVRAEAGAGPASESILLMGGVVGYQLPPLRPSTTPVSEGDTLLLTTDGIQTGFSQALVVGEPAQRTADRILADYARQTDDALVVVARYLGSER